VGRFGGPFLLRLIGITLLVRLLKQDVPTTAIGCGNTASARGPSEVPDADECIRRVPALGRDRLVGGTFCGQDGSASPFLWLDAPGTKEGRRKPPLKVVDVIPREELGRLRNRRLRPHRLRKIIARPPNTSRSNNGSPGGSRAYACLDRFGASRSDATDPTRDLPDVRGQPRKAAQRRSA
jgi:hypothetical protein